MKNKPTKAILSLAVIAIVTLSALLMWRWIASRDQPEDLSKYFSTLSPEVYKQGIQEKYAIKNFDDILDDFQAIIDLIEPYREAMEKAEYNYFGVGYDTDYDCIFSSTTKKIKLSPAQQSSLKSIARSFFPGGTGTMTQIGIEPSQIKFLSEWKNYAIVYTDDDVAPTTLWFAEAEVRVKKIRPHWYHVFDVSY